MPFSVRVVGDHRPDYYDLETLLNFHEFKDKSGESLALALYDFFTSEEHGIYHFWPVNESKGRPTVSRSISDSIKILNAFGWMICGQNSAFLLALYTTAEMKARTYGLPGHSLCEVFFDGRWHHIDFDMRTWFRTPEGHIASAEELAADALKLIVENENKSDPCNLPDRSLEDYAKMYAAVMTPDGPEISYTPFWTLRAHTMDFRLRPGETLVRSGIRQGRFLLPESWLASREKYAREWVGYPRERFEPFRSYGNGRWIYSPKLSADCTDLETGAWKIDGVKQDSKGISGPGNVTFRICSPYPFCGVPAWFDDGKVRVSDGVFIRLDGFGPVSVELTDSEGRWRTVAEYSGAFTGTADVSELMDSRYDAFLRLVLAKGARIEKFIFNGYIMTSPVSLPYLVEGENRMKIRELDRFGLRTEPWNETIDFRKTANMEEQAESLASADIVPHQNGMLKIAPAGDNPLEAVFRFDSPPSKKFAWFHAMAQVKEGPAGQPPLNASLQWSSDGEDWKVLGEIDISNTENQWDTNIEGRARIPEGGEKVFLKVTSGTALTALEFYGRIDYGEDDPGRLKVTHRWVEGDEEVKEFTAPEGEKEYVIRCGAAPREQVIIMSVDSMKKK